MTPGIAEGRAVVAVMARLPGSADVKTRLAPRLDAGARAGLYAAFLRDKLEQVVALREVALVVAVAPPATAPEVDPWLPSGASALVQRGADLGERLAAVTADLFVLGARAVLLVDSDTPTLPLAYLEDAVRALDERSADVVLGPAEDGGYYLVGMREPHLVLFRGIPWSTPAVLQRTQSVAAAHALRAQTLRPWYDVDRPEDLDRLIGELRALSPVSPGYPRETARCLQIIREQHERPWPRT